MRVMWTAAQDFDKSTPGAVFVGVDEEYPTVHVVEVAIHPTAHAECFGCGKTPAPYTVYHYTYHADELSDATPSADALARYRADILNFDDVSQLHLASLTRVSRRYSIPTVLLLDASPRVDPHADRGNSTASDYNGGNEE